jgi:hypothetical protein
MERFLSEIGSDLPKPATPTGDVVLPPAIPSSPPPTKPTPAAEPTPAAVKAPAPVDEPEVVIPPPTPGRWIPSVWPQ